MTFEAILAAAEEKVQAASDALLAADPLKLEQCSGLLRDAAAYGTAAGSLCVRSKGAIPALPTRAEILSLIKTEGVR